MKNQVSYAKSAPQDFDDMGGKRQAVYAGKCVVCDTRVYQERDYHGAELGPVYDPDWRGALGNHSACSMVAEEYGATGADVLTCAICANTADKYQHALAIAKKQWGTK